MTETMIKLAYPFKLPDGRSFESVQMRRPKGRDMPLIVRIKQIEAASAPIGEDGEGGLTQEEADEINSLIIRAVTNLDLEALDEIDLLEDLPVVREAALSFFAGIGQRHLEQTSGAS